MEVYYSDMKLPKKFGESIFLAGPSPRDENIKSWRIEALNILKENGYMGEVYVPERKGGWDGVDYIEQVEWEHEALHGCDVILFWVPRDIQGGMPGLTTNVEFGLYCGDHDRNIVYGRPDDADKIRYLDFVYVNHTGEAPKNTLEETLLESMHRSENAQIHRDWACMRHCCEMMVSHCVHQCNNHESEFDCPDSLIHYEPEEEKYGIIIHDGGCSWLEIKNCPWCGKNLRRFRENLLSGEDEGTAIAISKTWQRKNRRTRCED